MDVEGIINIAGSLIIGLIAVLANFISGKKSKKQDKSTQDIITMMNNIAEEQIKESERIVNEITVNLGKGQSTEITGQLEDILKGINKKSSKVLGNTDFDNKIEELIQNHHEQAIQQSIIQFWFSLIASVVGFVFIIVIILISDNIEWYEYIVKVVPGIIIEAVSVLFFSQSKETRERASDLLNRLREDRQYTKSNNLIESINDEKLKSLVKAEIALNLCGIKNVDVISNELENNKY